MTVNIWWIRRDLRLADNQALMAALSAGEQVVPAFIIDPSLVNSPMVGEKRRAFLWAGLKKLDEDLRAKGSYLVVRCGQPREALATLWEETQANFIFAEEDYTPYARRRDHLVQEQLPFKRVKGLTVHHPSGIAKADGNPYRVYSPFRRAWLAKPRGKLLYSAPSAIPTPAGIASEAISEPETQLVYPAGSTHAQQALQTFLNQHIYDYESARNIPGRAGTSSLSHYLRWGMISAQQAVVSACQAMQTAPGKLSRDSAETWLHELIWREFFMFIMYHYPFARRQSFRANLRNIQWRNDPDEFTAWCEGRTGYPIVDAGMRQLAQTGWMHNRVRMITASFLVKDLLIDWRWGERWFMQHLLDGDLAVNNGNWQWVAGTGTDAAPYFRVFNPTTQSKKFDPAGTYIRHWIPELQNVPQKYIHDPSTMPQAVQQSSGCLVGQDYPPPIVNHKFARQRTLETYNLAK